MRETEVQSIQGHTANKNKSRGLNPGHQMLKPYYVHFFLCFLGPYPWHTEVPRLGVESELQLPAYGTTVATWDPSRICDLHPSSWQRWIFNPLSETRDRTQNLMVPIRIHFHCTTTGTPQTRAVSVLSQITFQPTTSSHSAAPDLCPPGPEINRRILFLILLFFFFWFFCLF